MHFAEGIERAVIAGRIPDARTIREVVEESAERLGERGVRRHTGFLEAELAGLGPLAALAVREGVTDILVNGSGETWADRGAGLERVPDHDFESAEHVRRFAVRLAGVSGRRLDDAQPWVDGLLPGAVRLHAILPPLAAGGTCVSLRLLRRDAVRLADLQAAGMCTPGEAIRLGRLVREREAFVVTGGTGPARRRSWLRCWVRSMRMSGSWSWRMSWKCRSTAAMWCGCRRGRPMSRGMAVSASWTWSGRRCACARTGWSWGRSGARRSASCSRH